MKTLLREDASARQVRGDITLLVLVYGGIFLGVIAALAGAALSGNRASGVSFERMEARAIAEEWTRMTFTNDKAFVGPVVDMMMGSREAAVDYMTPLGLAHLMGTGHHYGPAPWVDNAGRPDFI